MTASLLHVTADTPMGATLLADGATFRVWAPSALEVHVVGDFNGWQRSGTSLLNRDGQGHWRGFFAGASDRQQYMFHVVGIGSEGLKRDPYARELTSPAPWRCILRSADFPWHDTGHRPPRFEDLVIYQLHVGAFFAPRWPLEGGTFLDVACKLPHLADLGVTAIQLLPIQEFQTTFSLGYNGTDYFSPEMAFGMADAEIDACLPVLNTVLATHRQPAYLREDLRGGMNQLKALIDLCHVCGIAVLLDVVYNHAGGDFGDESLYFFDRQAAAQGNLNSLYFSDKGHAGGLVFDYAKADVRQFLIDNARYFLDEYRVDGFRYDQVSVIDHDGAPNGWRFCQDLTSTLHFHRPGALNHAEYWGVNPCVVAPVSMDGAGFDTTLTDGLRDSVRAVISGASAPDERPLNMSALADSLWPPGFDRSWRFVQGPENHDIVYVGRQQRVARLAQPDDPRSWFARSRARVATGIGLTAPGIPMLFMGQEFLEDKPWCDDLGSHPELRIYWGGLEAGDKHMLDHLRFMRELIALRVRLPALRGDGFRVIHAHDANRVLVFQRWVEGQGQDVVVAIHLGPFHRFGYRVGMPGGGRWAEVFNSDVYENWVNPDVVGNGGGVDADAAPMHGQDHSASLALPANSLLVFAR